MVTLTVMLSTIVSALDGSIVNIALPVMRGSFGASVNEITWVTTAYMLSNVVAMPAVAFFSARLGRCRYFAWSVILFGVGSVLCGLAWDLPSMIFFRVLQGFGGGALIPLAQAILRETFPPEEQGKVMGIYGMGVILGPAVGPTLGGWITDNFSWPWIFYINVPVVLIDLALVPLFLRDPAGAERERGRADLFGLASMTLGLSALQILLEKGQEHNWFESSLIVRLGLVSAIALVLFVLWELRTDRPAVELRVLRNVPFAAATGLGIVVGIGLFGSLFLLPMFLQQVLGYSAMDSGIALLPRSLSMALLMPFVGRLYNRIGPRILVGGGFAVNGVAFFLMGRLTPTAGAWDLFLPQLLQGLGFALIFVALSTAALMTVESRLMTGASGLFNLVRTVFGSVGIALSSTGLERATALARATLAAHLTATSDGTREWLSGTAAALVGRGMDPADAAREALRLLEGLLSRQAAVIGYNQVFQWVGVLFLAAVPAAWVLHREGRGKEAAPAADPEGA